MAQEVPRELTAQALAQWDQAMKDQRAAERQLDAARRKRAHDESVDRLHAQVLALRNRADLLLAKAVATQLGKLPDFLETGY